MTAIRLPTDDRSNFGNAPGDGPLRPGGVSMGALPASEAYLPSTPSAQVRKFAPSVEMCRDLWAGNERLHEKGPQYLPKEPGEASDDYRVRLARSVFYNVFRHTITGLAGFVFRTDPALGEDVPTGIVKAWENIDLAGTHGDVWARRLLVDRMITGWAGILVEFPKTGGAQNPYEESSGAVRPYFVPIQREQVMSARFVSDGGRPVLTQLVIRECGTVAMGSYGEREQVRYRVLYRTEGVVGFRLLEVTEDKRILVADEGTYTTQAEIPIAWVGSLDEAPPFLDLAYLNVAHYQQWSDHATSIHKTCVPVLFTAGFDLPDAVIGPNSGVNSPNPGSTMEYVSHSGQALAQAKAALDDLLNQMAALGLAALASEKRAAETATAKRISKGATDSALAVLARELQDGLEQAAGLMARYMGLGDDGGSVEINRDFGDTGMAAEMLTAYVGAVANAGLPVRVLTEAMQRGGLLSEDVDLDEMDAELMANAEAAQEQQRLDAEAKMAALRAAPGAKPDVPEAAPAA
jgi:hypothetical protein